MISSLSGLHFLITYGCSVECDHCFLWGSPNRSAAMTTAQIDDFIHQVSALGTVTEICAEGGESFTKYDVLLHFLQRATAAGLKASALTNASWVQSRAQTQARIAELMAAGLTNLGISTDQWHQRFIPVSRVELLLEVCKAASLPASRMETAIEGVMFRGRAAHLLAADHTRRSPEELTSCPHEKLDSPSRCHLDCYGSLHLCQGLTLGALPLSEAVAAYDPAVHPIVRQLLNGGPFALARFATGFGFQLAPRYADACHLCYRAREFLRPHFPDLLGPDEMYGS